jgi:hypothetical protein
MGVAVRLRKRFAATEKRREIIKSNDFPGKIANTITDLSGGKTSDG